jgi:ABC-type transport system involved in multi-copper enzyme maturation permease subunit
MNSLPVIVRELRSQARGGSIHRLRLVSALALTATVGLLLLGGRGSAPQAGAHIFVAAHCVVLVLMGIFIPVAVADSIAREKREGTLGLLLLTELSSDEVAVAKGLVNALRSFSILLAAIPIMVVPVFQGGVQGMDVATVVVFESSALVLALAGGILASSITESAGWAMFLSVVFTAAFVALLAVATFVGYCLQEKYLRGSGIRSLADFGDDFFRSVRVFSGLAGGTEAWGGAVRAFGPGASRVWVLQLAESFLLSCLGLALALRFAARSIEISVRGAPPTPWRIWWRQAATVPVGFGSGANGRARHRLGSNPVVWLHAYDWRARIVKWSWCLGIVLFEVILFALHPSVETLFGWQPILAIVLGAAGLAVNASRSFRRERELAAFELLLVTPITENQLILGRLGALYLDFLPALAVVLGCAIAGSFDPLGRYQGLFERWNDLVLFLWVTVNCYLLLPVVGLNNSVRVANAFLVWMIICVWGIGYGFLEIVLTGKATKAIFAAADAVGHKDFKDWLSMGIVLAVLVLAQLFVLRFCWYAFTLRLTRQTFSGIPS